MKDVEVPGVLKIEKCEDMVQVWFVNSRGVYTLLGFFDKREFIHSSRLDSANRLINHVTRGLQKDPREDALGVVDLERFQSL